ncbi:MAG: hypothetical protein JWO11_4106 [Nocardioides sp.]|nr:hypothetical protein [Nocardioides sp.]
MGWPAHAQGASAGSARPWRRSGTELGPCLVGVGDRTPAQRVNNKQLDTTHTRLAGPWRSLAERRARREARIAADPECRGPLAGALVDGGGCVTGAGSRRLPTRWAVLGLGVVKGSGGLGDASADVLGCGHVVVNSDAPLGSADVRWGPVGSAVKVLQTARLHHHAAVDPTKLGCAMCPSKSATSRRPSMSWLLMDTGSSAASASTRAVRGWPTCVGLMGSSCPCLNRSADPRHSAACRRTPDLSDLLDMWVIFVGHLAGNDPVVHEERRPNAECQPLFDQVAGLVR